MGSGCQQHVVVNIDCRMNWKVRRPQYHTIRSQNYLLTTHDNNKSFPTNREFRTCLRHVMNNIQLKTVVIGTDIGKIRKGFFL